MAREYFKNLPDKTTPLSANRINGLLNGEESIEKIVVGKIESKNIFNKENVEIGYRLDAAGSLFALDGYFCSFFIEVSPNTIYTGNWTFGAYESICYYTSDKIFIERNITEATFTTPENAAYIRMCGPISEIGNRQLEKGSVVTEYTPHINFSNEQIYSTQEQIIGKWIDGKPIYRKTYHGITTFDLDNVTQTLISASVNVDKLINYSGYLTENNGNNVLTLNEVRIVKTANNRVIFQNTRPNDSLLNCPYAITFEYTKTTD